MPDHMRRSHAAADAQQEPEDVSTSTADSSGSMVGHKRAREAAAGATAAAAAGAAGARQGAVPWGSAYAGVQQSVVQQELPGSQAPPGAYQRPGQVQRVAQYQSAAVIAGQGQGNAQTPGAHAFLLASAGFG